MVCSWLGFLIKKNKAPLPSGKAPDGPMKVGLLDNHDVTKALTWGEVNRSNERLKLVYLGRDGLMLVDTGDRSLHLLGAAFDQQCPRAIIADYLAGDLSCRERQRQMPGGKFTQWPRHALVPSLVKLRIERGPEAAVAQKRRLKLRCLWSHHFKTKRGVSDWRDLKQSLRRDVGWNG
ncbi:hypothetical protein THF1D04_220012 [Vibrio owensii]|uniref:Uncharacterized protein n=1 Tax=Vibrio owensii TaxID=696485 RepID=A0AAU9Q718_9VIBR|nr:hypothetical protein THF1D04_220012 [Vibrio owensii]